MLEKYDPLLQNLFCVLCWERKTSWKYLYNHHQRVVLESYDFPSTLILVSVILLPQVTNNSIPEKLPSVVKGTNDCTSRHKVILWRIFENLLKCDTVDPLPSFYTTKKLYKWYPDRGVPLWFFQQFWFRSFLSVLFYIWLILDPAKLASTKLQLKWFMGSWIWVVELLESDIKYHF